MAVRINRAHDERTRQKIKTSQLINRLQDNAMGDLEPEMSLGQIRSAIALINKVVPDAAPVSDEPSDRALMIALVRRLIVDKAEPQTIEGRSVELPALPEEKETHD